MLGLSEGLSKLIPIDEQPNHQIVHLFRLGKTLDDLPLLFYPCHLEKYFSRKEGNREGMQEDI